MDFSLNKIYYDLWGGLGNVLGFIGGRTPLNNVLQVNSVMIWIVNS